MENANSKGYTIGPFIDGRQVLNAELIANQLKALRPAPVYSANLFDLKHVLHCLCKFLSTCLEGPSTWHRLFDEDGDYRNELGWEKLQELYWESPIMEEDRDLVKYTLVVFESYFNNDYRPIMSAFLLKLVGKD